MYKQVKKESVPPQVRFDTPGRFAGQHIEISFGGFGRYVHDVGALYKREIDHCSRRTTYYKLERGERDCP